MPRPQALLRAAAGTMIGAIAVGAATLPVRATAAHAVAAPSAAACARISTPDERRDAETLLRIEQAWLTAEYHGHRDYLECLLEPDYQTSSRSGRVRSRQDVIEAVPAAPDDTRPVPKLETIVVIHGNAATAHSTLKSTDKAGNPKEVHFVDGYTFHDGRWFAFSGADL